MFYGYRIDRISVGLRYVMKEEHLANRVSKCDRSVATELLLDPIDMTEELMFHIFNNDMNRELDGRWLDLYVSLQHYLDYSKHLEKLEEE